MGEPWSWGSHGHGGAMIMGEPWSWWSHGYGGATVMGEPWSWGSHGHGGAIPGPHRVIVVVAGLLSHPALTRPDHLHLVKIVSLFQFPATLATFHYRTWSAGRFLHAPHWPRHTDLMKYFKLGISQGTSRYTGLVNRPGVAGAVLQTAL